MCPVGICPGRCYPIPSMKRSALCGRGYNILYYTIENVWWTFFFSFFSNSVCVTGDERGHSVFFFLLSFVLRCIKEGIRYFLGRAAQTPLYDFTRAYRNNRCSRPPRIPLTPSPSSVRETTRRSDQGRKTASTPEHPWLVRRPEELVEE